ncbi:hypothetical protein [Nocardiopsis kunsanensis]|uniref:hypothetical protein n=1 Tax=Nocardiopsis kunsanensis TaxID=141693 RepID=UPI00034836B1|nr:hypothetical protein [Nocardiopsis kunsanensis]
MARSVDDPDPQRRRPLATGTGHTGNPCEYPGCTDKNASLSVLWDKPDQEHDFGGTNRVMRCAEHRGMDVPRVPRPRSPVVGVPEPRTEKAAKPKKTKKGKKAKGTVDVSVAGRSTSRAPEQRESSYGMRFLGTPEYIDVPELYRMRKRATLLVVKDPERTLRICSAALGQEKRMLAEVGRRVNPTMEDFRRLHHKAMRSLKGHR